MIHRPNQDTFDSERGPINNRAKTTEAKELSSENGEICPLSCKEGVHVVRRV